MFAYHDKLDASLVTSLEFDYDPNQAYALSSNQQSYYVSQSIEETSTIGSTFIPKNTLFTCQYFFELQ
jgi:hypothetical protein